MLSLNVRRLYQKNVIKTYLISGFLFFLIFGIDGLLSIKLYKYVKSSTVFTVGAIYFFLCHKYFIPFFFYRNLNCPQCGQQYLEYRFGKSVRMDLLNQSACQSCQYQVQFEM